MIAVILAAGNGTRLASRYSCSSKCMIPINGKTIIGSKVKELSYCKHISKIYIVIKESEKEIPNYLGNACNGVPIAYCTQSHEKTGIVNSLYSVTDLFTYTNTDVLINLGDEYYDKLNYDDFIDNYYKKQLTVSPVLIYSSDEEQIKANYTVDLDDDFRIFNAIEKPQKVFNNFIGCGTMIISGQLLEDFAIHHNYDFNGKELIDWIKFANARNMNCYGYKTKVIYCNLNNQKDLQRVYEAKSRVDLLALNYEVSQIYISCFMQYPIFVKYYNMNNGDVSNVGETLLGVPLNDNRVYILDSDRKLLGFNAIGDIWIHNQKLNNDLVRSKSNLELEIHPDIVNENEYMIKLNEKGAIKFDGNYYCLSNSSSWSFIKYHSKQGV
jgi:NDP-sugar pyrophosphorylase family protein